MARRKKPTAAELFEKGTDFFNSINETIGLAKDLFFVFRDAAKENTKRVKEEHVVNDIEDNEKIKQSAYRFMKLKPGCGALLVKSRFREMVKERRPDLSKGNENTDWYTALQVARTTLLKYEN